MGHQAGAHVCNRKAGRPSGPVALLTPICCQIWAQSQSYRCYPKQYCQALSHIQQRNHSCQTVYRRHSVHLLWPVHPWHVKIPLWVSCWQLFPLHTFMTLFWSWSASTGFYVICGNFCGIIQVLLSWEDILCCLCTRSRFSVPLHCHLSIHWQIESEVCSLRLSCKWYSGQQFSWCSVLNGSGLALALKCTIHISIIISVPWCHI